MLRDIDPRLRDIDGITMCEENDEAGGSYFRLRANSLLTTSRRQSYDLGQHTHISNKVLATGSGETRTYELARLPPGPSFRKRAII